MFVFFLYIAHAVNAISFDQGLAFNRIFVSLNRRNNDHQKISRYVVNFRECISAQTIMAEF